MWGCHGAQDVLFQFRNEADWWGYGTGHPEHKVWRTAEQMVEGRCGKARGGRNLVRTRKEILTSGEDKRQLQLEVLLDIRDILAKALKKKKKE